MNTVEQLTNKVRALAEEAEYCWGEWSVCVSSYDGEWNDWLIQVKAACREYSGILRGLLRGQLAYKGDKLRKKAAIELIVQVWRETLRSQGERNDETRCNRDK